MYKETYLKASHHRPNRLASRIKLCRYGHLITDETCALYSVVGTKNSVAADNVAGWNTDCIF